jgi:hypothetical protein
MHVINYQPANHQHFNLKFVTNSLILKESAGIRSQEPGHVKRDLHPDVPAKG